MILEVINKEGKKIRLTDTNWKHIKQEHSEVNIEEIRLTLENQTKITTSKYDTNVKWHYRLNKEKNRYLMVSVKYLNKEGFIITAFYTRKIK